MLNMMEFAEVVLLERMPRGPLQDVTIDPRGSSTWFIKIYVDP